MMRSQLIRPCCAPQRMSVSVHTAKKIAQQGSVWMFNSASSAALKRRRVVAAGKMHLLDLGDNGLEGVFLSSTLAVPALGRLSCACKSFRETLNDATFLRRLTAAHGFTIPTPAADTVDTKEEGVCVSESSDIEDQDSVGDNSDGATGLILSAAVVDSLEVLSVLCSISQAIKTNHIVFHLASLKMVKQSKDVLGEYAKLMRRHPRLRMRIDSHTGVGAPPPIAPQHSVQRACVVARQLVALGIELERVMACAWGMDVGRARRWPASQEYARAEVYLAMEPYDKRLTTNAKEAGLGAGDGEGDGNGKGGNTGEIGGVETDKSPSVPQFAFERCIPCWPAYYEGIEPRVASVPSGELAGNEESEHDSEGDDGGGNGMPAGLMQVIALMHGLAPGDTIVLPNGQHLMAADLLGAMLAQGGSELDDDDADDGDDVESEGAEEDGVTDEASTAGGPRQGGGCGNATAAEDQIEGLDVGTGNGAGDNEDEDAEDAKDGADAQSRAPDPAPCDTPADGDEFGVDLEDPLS